MPKRYTVSDFADSLEGIDASAVFMQLATPGLLNDPGADVQVLFQMAAAILMDKPMLVVVPTGTEIPEHLRRIADELVEFDMSSGASKAAAGVAIKDAMERLKARFPA